jgi:hypothetical protein
MDFKNEFIIELMECILSGADELQVKHMLDKETQNLQLQQTGVMARCNMSLIGKELNYISPITKAKQPFKVSDVFVNIFIQGLKERQVYAEVFAVSEKGNKYKIDEFSEVQV